MGKFNFLRIFPIQTLIFSLIVTIYVLSLIILTDTYTSASIAASQFMSDVVSLFGIYFGVLLLGAFNLFFLIGVCIVNLVFSLLNDKFHMQLSILMTILHVLNFFFSLISESIFYKFASCFYFSNNGIVVARSGLAIGLQAFFICIFVYNIGHSIFKYLRGKEGTNLVINGISLIFIFPCIVILVLNAVLISRIKPQLNYHLQPSNIRVGFFDSNEIVSIQNQSYAKSNTYDQQIIGNLGDIIFNSNKKLDRVVCEKTDKGSICIYYYWHTYLHEVNCTSKSILFYKDFTNSSSLTVIAKYLDEGPYPTYNCLVNKINNTCASTCSQLLSNYSLILIQDFKNKVQTAWTGLSICNTNINFRLKYNSFINPCETSFSFKLKGNFLFIALSLILFF